MARKPRQNRYFPEKTESKWKAGVYARLSVSDNRVYGESLIYQLKLAQEALLLTPEVKRYGDYPQIGRFYLDRHDGTYKKCYERLVIKRRE